jgi:phosphohistidine phosphatase SixA
MNTHEPPRKTLTEAQAKEIQRLASVIGTASVRRYAVSKGVRSNETAEGVQARLDPAKSDLQAYLEQIGA